MLRSFLSFICLLIGVCMLNAQSLWLDVPASAAPSVGERRIVPDKFRAMRLNINTLQSALAQAPEAFSPAANAENLPIIEVPTPDGKTSRFQIVETPVMASALQEKYPDIRCYTGRGIDDHTAKIKLDVTPWGFHAMVTSVKDGAYFIDPMVHGNRDFYVVYFKKDYLAKPEHALWNCGNATPEGALELEAGHTEISTEAADFQGDTKLRRYRLALACTGEYAAFHGGTKPLVLAAMNTTMNRVNGVYETDFAVTMKIIPNNDLLIYLNAGTDPYTNNDGGTMLSQNIANCNSVIGITNYDMGHVFSTGGGGVAFLGVICSGNKAGGVTGLGSPIGDPFDIDYVAHEMGHQFGGPHSFNGTAGSCSGNGSAANAVEPGSGTTIMAYAGICGAHNVQPNSNAYFHAKSMINMTAHAITGTGNTCAEKITTTNHNPDVNAGLNYTIPKSTPFALTAIGSDIDADTLTYTWEQMDAAVTTSPPVATSATGPLFRSFTGTTSPTRVFPRMVDIVNNVTPTWEKLPSVARAMNFRVVLRDNDWLAGCTDEDDALITVSGTSGPFLVTVPNTNILWNVGTTQTVTWDVANTTAAPVSCANVRILLSTDGGFTYPVELAASEPNDGSATILVPNNVGNTCRVKVEGLGNIFFDISNANFRIDPPLVPTFFLTTNVMSSTVCAGLDATFNLDLSSVLAFNTPTNITITGAPAGATLNISTNPVVPAGSATVTISNLTPAMAGVYTLNIQAVGGAITRNAAVTLTVLPGAPSEAILTSPVNGETGISTVASLNWGATFADAAVVEVATNPTFSAGSIVSTQTVSGSTASVAGLISPLVYYWRVRTSNTCGEAAYSPVFAFQTGGPSCDHNFSSTDVPKVIDQATINSVVSTLTIAENNTIEDINVNLAIDHSYIGDVDVRLVSPFNDTIDLFDRPGVDGPASGFGCDSDNADLTFDSQAAQDATVLENQCNGTPPALSGTFQSIESLTVLSGKNTQGLWQLLVTDNYPEDGGAVTAWSLSFCYPVSAAMGNILANNPLSVPTGGSGNVETANLQMTISGASNQGQYLILSLPEHGALTLNGAPLAVGDMFTQADIDAGLIAYTHNGDASIADNFHFDALDSNNNGWVHNGIFNIIVQINNLVATAVQTQEVLCYNGATGQITVSATGLNGAYTYSLNGGVAQGSNVFNGLSAGTYTVVVTGQFGYTISANSVTLANAVEIMASAAVATDDITVTASGGTGALEYSLNGVDFQPGNTFNDLLNGVYVVTVRDENGCTASTEAIVAVNSLLITVNLQDTISCAGGTNGSVSINVGGGEMPYSYSLNGGTGQSSNIFTGLSAGTYTVIVTDNLGFSATTPAIVLTEPAAIMASATAVLNAVTVTASGGTGALMYSLNGGAYQVSNVFAGVTNGTYIVRVQDENGCTVLATVTVDVPPLVLSASNTATLNCFGGAEGMIIAFGSGGILPYEYRLNNGAYQSSNMFLGLTAGTYLVWVRDAAGTEASFTATINQPSQVTVSVLVNYNDATAIFSGGIPPYSVTTNAPNIDLQNLANGTYTLNVTDANGCSTSTTFTVNVLPLVWSVLISNVTCYGDMDGSATFVPTGGIPPYTYSFDGGPYQSSNTFPGLVGGEHTIDILDSDGTQVSGTIMVSEPVEVLVDATVFGNTIDADAIGVLPIQFSLNGGLSQTSGTFSNLSPGTYTIVVTDANGCTASIGNLTVTTGVVEPATVWGLTVSPNPGSGLFQLTMQQAPASLRAEVFDAAGRLLRALNFAPNGGQFTTSIDLRELPNGTYLLRLTDGQQWGGVRLSKVE